MMRLTVAEAMTQTRSMLPPRPIPRIDAPSPEVFRREYVQPGRPVVLRGLLDDWPAYRTWSTDTLRSRFGDTLVPVLRVVEGAVQVDARRGLVTQKAPFVELLDDLDAGLNRTYMMAHLDDLPEGMRSDLRLPRYCQKAPWHMTKLWCSAAGTRSALHFDLNDNLHSTLRGRKRFTLFSPEDNANLYRGRLLTGIPNASRVDLDNLDLKTFPRVARAQPWTCEVEPGETLFMPRSWWHHVATVESSITVNTWWATGARLLVTAAAGTFKRLWGVSR